MSNEQIANYVVLIIVVGALVIGLISMLVGKVVSMIDWTRDQMAQAVQRERANMSSARRPVRAPEVVQNRPEMPPRTERTEPANQPNPALQSGSPLGTSSLELNAQEIAAIGRMIEHKASAEKPNKASTIWAGFAIKKGDSARYKRASEIYDALFVFQADFPALEATRLPKWDAETAH
jgi:hypothetical protein